MNVLIVENEKPAVVGLSKLLKKVDHTINIVGTTESVESTINWFQNNSSPELIFMDIQLDDGLSFEIFELMQLDIPVIFTTAYDEYLLSAFKVNSVDYLLKPISFERLLQSVKKFLDENQAVKSGTANEDSPEKANHFFVRSEQLFLFPTFYRHAFDEIWIVQIEYAQIFHSSIGCSW